MRILRCADKSLTFERPHIMGVLNITPDSFSDGGQLWRAGGADLACVRKVGKDMIAAGASILDIGGESTRPGAAPVTIAEELNRVMPVVEVLADLDTIISVDTRHAQVAAAAIDAGAHMINDVSAGDDPGMLQTVADKQVGYVLMHMQGAPQTMQRAPAYKEVVKDVGSFLETRFAACLQAGIEAQHLIVDPGFGFGKSMQHNLSLLANLSKLRVAGRPLMVGLSRKSMLGKITGREVHERVHASAAAALLAAERGADILRVHDVGATQDALKVYDALQLNLANLGSV